VRSGWPLAPPELLDVVRCSCKKDYSTCKKTCTLEKYSFV